MSSNLGRLPSHTEYSLHSVEKPSAADRVEPRTGAVAVGGGLGDGAGQRTTTAHLGGKPAELLLFLHKLDLLERDKRSPVLNEDISN